LEEEAEGNYTSPTDDIGNGTEGKVSKITQM
jgi:hypothetical protein